MENKRTNRNILADLGAIRGLLIRSLSLILAAALVSGGLMYFRLQRGFTPLYQASAYLMVSSDSAPEEEADTLEVQDQEAYMKTLIATYANLIRGQTLLNLTIGTLDLDWSYEKLLGRCEVASLAGTHIIVVNVTDSDPEKALDIARTIVSLAPGVLMDMVGEGSIREIEQAYEKPAAINSVSNIKILAAAVAGGLLACLVLACLILFRKSFQTAALAARQTGLPVLGTLPKGTGEEKEKRVEGLRLVLSRIRHALPPADPEEGRVVLAADAAAGDGALKTCQSLAALGVRGGLRVLVADGNLRRSGKAKEGKAAEGLTDLLSARRNSWRNMVQTGAGGDFLPAGTPVRGGADLWQSPEAARLFKELRREYDLVFLVPPAASAFPDAAAQAPLADGAVFFLTLGQTARRDAAAAVDLVAPMDCPLLGLVLTDL